METINVLVVDDDKEIVNAICKLLESEGYKTLKAYDGLEAIDILTQNTVHLIILDIMMPNQDGLTTTLKIRNEKNIEALCPIRTVSQGKVTNKTIPETRFIWQYFFK